MPLDHSFITKYFSLDSDVKETQLQRFYSTGAPDTSGHQYQLDTSSHQLGTPIGTSWATSGHQLGHQLKTVIALVCNNSWPDPNNFLYDHNTMMYGHIYRVEDTGKCLRA